MNRETMIDYVVKRTEKTRIQHDFYQYGKYFTIDLYAKVFDKIFANKMSFSIEEINNMNFNRFKFIINKMINDIIDLSNKPETNENEYGNKI